VVGPGRIQVVTRVGLRGVADPRAPSRDRVRFVIDEITRTGDQRLAEGVCPGHPIMSQLVGLVRLPAGETGLVCLENGTRDGCVPDRRICTKDDADYTPWGCDRISCDAGFVHFGLIDHASHAIAWRWRIEVEFGVDAKDVRMAAVCDRVAIVYRFPRMPPNGHGWIVVFGPDGRVAEPPEPFDDSLSEVITAGEELKLIFKSAHSGARYRELTVAKGGASSWVELERGRVTPGALSGPCLAEDGDGSLTVSLPYPDEGQDPDEGPPARRTLTLRYPNAFAPHGPDVYPTSRASCAPRIAAAAAEWARASFDAVGPIIVYALGGGAQRPRSLRVERRAR
jgi:hypothetical protein